MARPRSPIEATYFLTQVISVVLMMACMTLCTLWLPLFDEALASPTLADAFDDNLSTRLSMVPTMVLAAVAFKLVLADALPITPRMTYLDWLFSAFYLAHCVAAFLTIVAYLHPPHAKLIDYVSIVTFVALLAASKLHFLKGYLRRARPIHQTAEGVHESREELRKRRQLKLRV